MRNRFISLLLCMLMIIMGIAVGTAIAEEHPTHLTVIATTYPLYDMAFQIGGGHLNVIYQPEVTAESIEGANILLCMGGEKDSWTVELEGVTVVRAMDGIELIEGEENVLTIPVNNMIVASYFTDALCVIDTSHGEMYVNNLGVYIEALITLDLNFRDVIKEGTKVFCEEGSMAYFAKEYGVEAVDTADSAVILNTYEYPAEEELTVSYIELMRKNLEALVHVE